MEMTSQNKDGKMIVFLKGEIDHHSAREMRDNIDRLIFLHRPDTLILDLAGIEFMDSSGLGLILGRYRKMCEYKGQTFICNASERTMKILKMAGVDKIIKSTQCRMTTEGQKQ